MRDEGQSKVQLVDDREESRLRRYAWLLAVFWTAIVCASLSWNLFQRKQEAEEMARAQARAVFQKDVLFRRWNAMQGGVYVPMSDKTPPNPYLDVAERDIHTPTGRQLTLVNPAYMTRQVFELQATESGVQGHITSLNPIRPENAADPWETEALKAFERGAPEVSSLYQINGVPYMRLMRPLMTEEPCLKCHAVQGYQVGDIRGGISVAVPMAPLRVIAQNHTPPLVLGHGTLWLLGLVGIGLGAQRVDQGIKDRKHVEEALRELNATLEARVTERTTELEVQYTRLDAILDSTTDGIVVVNIEGDIIQTNPVAQIWLTQTLSLKDTDRLREAVRDLATRADERPEMVLELTGLDLELNAAPVLGKETVAPSTIVVNIHDVSHLKAMNRIKTRFIENISHELRTPVTTIKSFAYLLQKTSPEKERWGEYLDTLAQEADHQARLVEDIMEISRIDAGRVEIEPRPTPLNELTELAVTNHQTLAQERGLTLEHRPETRFFPKNLVSLVDPERITQVLNNLMGNAIRYTPEGGTVTVSTGIEEAEGRTWVTVMVADTGMGIPAEELPYVFDRFFRGVEPRAMQLTGSGLGLAIVKEIVELHGGRVTVESEKGVGSAFTVWLPASSQRIKRPLRR